jgi:hypothetical protein
MGAPAEQAFEEWAEGEGVNYIRWGLDKPPLAVQLLPIRIRHAPDYLTTKCFVECQGVGVDQRVKLKVEKYVSLHYWGGLHPVDLFVWDSKNERHALVHLADVQKIIADDPCIGRFENDGKPYFELAMDALVGAND